MTTDNGTTAEERSEAAARQHDELSEAVEGEDQDAFDEPDDELEEFDEIGCVDTVLDSDVAHWDEDWDAAGWDDEDVNDDFIKRLQQELDAFKQTHGAKQQQQKAAS
ncbi:dss1 sem1 family protein [Cystoisospora suis]|uniref:Dss1 sem1 family protein n=1 Tax=Cystoisospora suis TaxID=483139 RepID=A0A2C6KWW0_9APIC|nr:dss1 sem1 family protein [Cystoisospora suis]